MREHVLDAASIVSLASSGTSMVPYLDGEPAEAEIRRAGRERSGPARGADAGCAAWVNEHVQQVASTRNVVVDGRDMGTAVFPEADVKVYLVADTWERAKRRLVQHLRRLPTDDEDCGRDRSSRASRCRRCDAIGPGTRRGPDRHDAPDCRRSRSPGSWRWRAPRSGRAKKGQTPFSRRKEPNKRACRLKGV